MTYRFYLIDRNNLVTQIKDPEGWDSLELELQRDEKLHGMVFNFQGNTFTFTGKAASLLRAEYNQYGEKGNMQLRITYLTPNGEKDLYAGQFIFGMWEETYGKNCGVTLSLEMSGDAMLFKTRMDQKVDLRTTTAFDQSALPAYNKLPFAGSLPGKSIVVADSITNRSTITGNYQDSTFIDDPNNTNGYQQIVFMVPSFDDPNAVKEIGGVYTPSGVTTEFEINTQNLPGNATTGAGWIKLRNYAVDNTWAAGGYAIERVPIDNISPIVNYDRDLGNVYGNGPITGLTLDLNLKGKVSAYFVSPANTYSTFLTRIGFYLLIRRETASNTSTGDPDGLDWYSNTVDPWAKGLNQGTGFGQQVSFDIVQTFSNLTLYQGDRIYLFFRVVFMKQDAYQTLPALTITYNSGSFFKLSGLSALPATPAKLFMVNEAFSRISEAITNGRIRAYSDFYGRTDAQPYASAADGCGSLTALTNGLFIRQVEQAIPARPTVYSVSIDDMIAGLLPIHNIGIGLEPDPQRSGYLRLRIEPWNFFYTRNVVFSCTNVTNIKRNAQPEDFVSVFKFGYEKWEAQEFNGIDEFLTSREYRTNVTSMKGTLTQKSTFIASGFALEVTRRKGSATSEDWRYDNDTFVIAMKRSAGSIVVEQGAIGNPTNIVDPATIYNFRLRPSVIALRWLPQVLASYRVASTSSSIYFTGGDGNFHASGWNNSPFCRLEATTPISERQDLSPAQMANPAEGLPVSHPETIEYDYPITAADFQTIKAKPYDLIYYSGDGVVGLGWLMNLKYKPEDGIATFTLKPARN